MNLEQAQLLISVIDLTSLNNEDTEETIITLCNKAFTPYGNVAAVCVYSQFIHIARKFLLKPLPIATVTNFPHGMADIELALLDTKLALDRGANEIDIVFPYHALIAKDSESGSKMVFNAKKLCEQYNALLKVIIETGELKTTELIKEASTISINNGADFIKTSTGKAKVNATIKATQIMLYSIKESGALCGFKAAGGVKTITQAYEYIKLAQNIMGDSWVTPHNFRLGASSLLNEILNK